MSSWGRNLGSVSSFRVAALPGARPVDNNSIRARNISRKRIFASALARLLRPLSDFFAEPCAVSGGMGPPLPVLAYGHAYVQVRGAPLQAQVSAPSRRGHGCVAARAR